MASEGHFRLLFGVRRSIRYHSKRQAFYERVDRWALFALLMLGSGSVAVMVQGSRTGTILIGSAVAAIAGLQLVFAFGSKASRHAELVREFTRIEQTLCADDSEEAVRAATQERLAVEADEPPVMRVLDAICHNELILAMGLDDERERVRLNWLQHLTANLLNIGERNLAKGS